jgi:hypothetical protein
VGVRGETFSGEDLVGMGTRGGMVMGRVRKGLTYLGAEVGGSGSAGAVARVCRVFGCSILTLERRLAACTAGFEI